MIGYRIKEIRKNHKLSQIDFSKRLGTVSGYISEIENDKKKPGASFLLSLKQEFNVCIDWLLTGEGDPYLKKEPPGEEKSSSKKIIVEHQDMVARFKNPDRAREMTRDLLEIEEISEELVEKIASNIKASLEAARTVSGLPKKTMND